MIRRQTSIGFAVKKDEIKEEQQNYDEMREKLMGQLKKAFRPEFLNRVDAVVVFRALTRDEITAIVDLEISKVQARLSHQEIKIEATPAAKQYLSDKGYNYEFGARPLRRVIQSEVEDKMSDGLLSGKFGKGDTVQIDLVEGNLTFAAVKKPDADLLTLRDTPEGDQIQPILMPG
jgi:ATP-dependent Clp protease ATP-binding subunit ClpC